MVKTTQDVIKVLPFDEAFKLRLLGVFDKLSPAQKYTLVNVLWDAYDAYFQIRLEQNINNALLDVADRKAELDPNFYQKIEKQTEEEFASHSVHSAEKVDLSKARESLEEILSNTQQSN